ncbi:MAG: hypothetical protein K2Q06_04420 [Parvularculaceae bacterium]|nr:hypothetical protein [Parvularculaceae bacterium]
MSRTDKPTHELFLRLGATPRIRSARADTLFRRLRGETRGEPEDGVVAAKALAERKSAAATHPAE